MNRLNLLASKYKAVETPFLLMDEDLLREQANLFKKHAAQCGIFYAVKANSNQNVMSLLNDYGIGFEVASQAELELVQNFTNDPKRVISGNPIKSPALIESMYKSGVERYVIDSTTEIDKLALLAPRSEVIIRLTVDNSSSAWPLSEKYGVEVEVAIKLFEYAAQLGLIPAGISFHVGSQCFDLDSWGAALSKSASLWDQCNAKGIHLKVLNLGGGFPANHGEDIPSLEGTFSYIFQQVSELFDPEVEIQVEPGRGLVADSGVMITTVIGKATRNDSNWLYLDCGVFNGLMESIGGINYLYSFNEHVHGEKKIWTLAGPSCDSVDVIAKNIALNEPEVGDRLSIYPAGAYTTAYASEFNGTQIPRVILGSNNG